MAGVADMMAQGAAPESVPDPAQEAAPEAVQEGSEEPINEEAPTSLSQEEPTPEEQEQFTKYELAVKTIIHDNPKRFDSLVAMLKAGKDDPVRTLARTALSIFGVLDGDVQGGIPEDYIMQVAGVCLDYVIEISEKLNIMQIDETLAEQALLEMVKQAGTMYGFDTEGLEQAVANGKANTQGGQPAQQAPQQAPQRPAAPQQAPQAAAPVGGM